MMQQKKHTSDKIRMLTAGALTAALYTALTYLAGLLGLASGVIQIRFSEALTILPAVLSPVLAPGAVLGLFIGCILSNALTGGLPWDIIFGSLATLLGAIGTYAMRKHPYLAWIPPVAANVIVVPQVLRYVYGVEDAIWFLMLTVGIGEVISCGVLGCLLYRMMKNRLEKL